MTAIKDVNREQRVEKMTARYLQREREEFDRQHKEKNQMIEDGMWLAFEELQDYSQKASKSEIKGIEKAKRVIREMQKRHEKWDEEISPF